MLSAAARDLAIRVILAEAEGEGPVGWRAVANVINNRSLSGKWGDRDQGGLTRLLTASKQFAAPKAVGPDNPLYQRVGAIVDEMASQETEDPTGGATHFYSPANMPGGVEPSWAMGQQGQRIGGHVFYRLPLNASTTAGTVSTLAPISGPAMGASPTGYAGQPSGGVVQSFTGGDYGREATAAAQPFRGIVVHVTGKPTLREELAYSSAPDPNRPGYYGYHYLIDRDGKVYQAAPDNVRTNHIMPNSQYGLNNSNAIGVAFVGGDKGASPEQMAAGKALIGQLQAKYNIAPNMVVGHGELDPEHGKGLSPGGGEEGQDFITAFRGGAAPVRTGYAQTVPEADKPAPDVQPVKAAQGPPATSPASPDANAKYQVLKGMTAGNASGGPNPFLYTAANWGGGETASPPAAPTEQPARPDLAQRVALNQTPTPPPRPPDLGAAPLSSSLTAPNNAAGGRNPNMNDARFGNAFAMAAPPLGAPPSPDVTQSIQRLLAGLFSSNIQAT